ncbi:MAG: SMC-Scp complex subunit ScpB [Firmicutes bacterium]|nr:SMC-Scp complex subunit ScpB [Bacillota bacterium]NLL87484.1 SMC-Scp complex subunit ScpB [Bacillota bacterium]HKM18300.1 SMC-Scp complex subunit ScpB [Limnochordia bacterium]
MTLEESYRIIEGLIFAAPYPLTVKEISEITEIDEKIVQRLIEDIAAKYENRGFMLRFVAGGYQFVTHPALKDWIEKLGRKIVSTPLSVPALETLAIVAYQQPVTRSEIEQIRGVRADSAINTLLERELIMELGRKDGPGRPILFGTTDKFLLEFNLKSLEDLPHRSEFPRLAGEREE